MFTAPTGLLLHKFCGAPLYESVTRQCLILHRLCYHSSLLFSWCQDERGQCIVILYYFEDCSFWFKFIMKILGEQELREKKVTLTKERPRWIDRRDTWCTQYPAQTQEWQRWLISQSLILDDVYMTFCALHHWEGRNSSATSNKNSVWRCLCRFQYVLYNVLWYAKPVPFLREKKIKL